MDTFCDEFRAGLHELMRWRRDVRHFRSDPVDPDLLSQCLETFRLAPSVGLSEPWRILRVTSDSARAKAVQNFQDTNVDALRGYSGDQANRYAGLKLSGMQDAPEHLAIYCDDATSKGAGLGAASMPEMRRYSVVGAINLMWLTARSHGLGIGWVSILDPARLNADLEVPKGWTLVAYLCLGWPQENTLTPELETKGWETRAPALHIETR